MLGQFPQGPYLVGTVLTAAQQLATVIGGLDSTGTLRAALLNPDGSFAATLPTRAAANYCGTIIVAAASTQCFPALATRRKFILVNDSDEDIYVFYGSPAVMGAGVRLNAMGGALTEDAYTGEVTAICLSGNKNLTAVEL